MNWKSYLYIFLYSGLVFATLVHFMLHIFGLSWIKMFQDMASIETKLLPLIGLIFTLSFLILFLVKIIEVASLTRVRMNLQRLIEGRQLLASNGRSLDLLFLDVSKKMTRLTENLQKSENQVLQEEEAIIEKERRRIARDLHDTVSQELFAANMILSGLSGQVAHLDVEQLGKQLKGVADILHTAQKDLRILLLHLRPTELEGRSLVEGLEVILKELAEKSQMTIRFEKEVEELPKQIEEHIFRIAQEIISNTLRHAQASCLEVYLYQTPEQLHLKMADDGIGFDKSDLEELSYGLKNIEERVHDMAGTIKILTAPKKGVAIDIRIPLLKGV